MHAYLMISRRPGHFTLLHDIRNIMRHEKNKYGPFEIFGIHDVILEAAKTRDVLDLYMRYIVPLLDIASVGACTTHVVAKEMPEKTFKDIPYAYLALDVAHPHNIMEKCQIEISQIDGIERSDIVLGPYDIIARIACEPEEFNEKLSKIQRIEGVLRTISFIIGTIPRSDIDNNL